MLAAVAFKGGIWLHAQWASVSVNADLSSTNSQSSGCTGNVRLDNEGKGVIEIGEGQSIYVLTSRTEDSMLLTPVSGDFTITGGAVSNSPLFTQSQTAWFVVDEQMRYSGRAVRVGLPKVQGIYVTVTCNRSH